MAQEQMSETIEMACLVKNGPWLHDIYSKISSAASVSIQVLSRGGNVLPWVFRDEQE